MGVIEVAYILGIILVILLLKVLWVPLTVIAFFLLLLFLLLSVGKSGAESKQTVTLSSSIDAMDGHTFEHWCAELLRQNGFTDVSVTPSSNDQGIDVLAYKDGLKYGVQCKCYANDLGNKPIQEATAGRAIYGCDIAVVMTNRYFTKGAVEAAKATGVWLWDRDKLARMVQDAKGAIENEAD